jgi:hypothetical protein
MLGLGNYTTAGKNKNFLNSKTTTPGKYFGAALFF